MRRQIYPYVKINGVNSSEFSIPKFKFEGVTKDLKFLGQKNQKNTAQEYEWIEIADKISQLAKVIIDISLQDISLYYYIIPEKNTLKKITLKKLQ